MMYSLSTRSESNLRGVHPDLVKVVRLALTYSKYDFGVSKSVRTLDEQQEKFDAGLSKTMKSRHIPSNNACGMSCAVDLVVYVAGSVSWSHKHYRKVAKAMFRAAIELGIQVEAGALFESFVDGPHFQLSWRDYP